VFFFYLSVSQGFVDCGGYRIPLGARDHCCQDGLHLKCYL